MERTPALALGLESLVVAGLEELASQARAQGQGGRAARLLDAVAFVRSQDAGEGGELTRREWEVARLVARGHSNRRIAHELVVSERTVDTHVSHILRKLELNSRAQIAAWVVSISRPVALPA